MERKEIETNPKPSYAAYQLQWMIDHGYSLEDLMRSLRDFQYDDPEDSNRITTPVDELFAEWVQDVGFDGEIWACEDEWKSHEGIETKVCPPQTALPERCFVYVQSTNEIGIIKKGESGYYRTDITVNNSKDGNEMTNELNEKLGVTKAQAEAMKAGSMFGWETLAADPKNYDPQGMPIRHPVAVGAIEFLGSNGDVKERIEYTGLISFLRVIRESNYNGEPMNIVIYKDCHGKSLDTDFVKELDPHPSGVRIENLCKWCENGICSLSPDYNVCNGSRYEQKECAYRTECDEEVL